MPPNLRSFSYFHTHVIWRTQPIALGALLLSACGLAVAGVMFIQQWNAAVSIQSEWRELDKRIRTAERSLQAVKSEPPLPAFSSGQLLMVLQRIAAESKLPLDEVAFVLDDNGNQPYLRYRAMLTVETTFPVIRSFIVRLHRAGQDISLDAVSCARADVATAPLRCEMSLSAFYRKAATGG